MTPRDLLAVSPKFLAKAILHRRENIVQSLPPQIAKLQEDRQIAANLAKDSRAKRDDLVSKVSSLKKERNDAQTSANSIIAELKVLSDANSENQFDKLRQIENTKKIESDLKVIEDLQLEIVEHKDWASKNVGSKNISNDLEEMRIKADKLLESGNKFGIKISYIEQIKPVGLAQAFIIAEDFFGSVAVCMVLGDYIFHGTRVNELLVNSVMQVKQSKKATVFGYYVNDPNRYGVLGFDESKKITSIDEKPLEPKSNYAVIGLYFYPNSVLKIAKNIKPSKRGELEITSVNNIYLENNNLNVQLLGSGYTWLDTGTPDSLLEASNFIQTIEKRQGKKVACIEEIAFNKGYINYEELKTLAQTLHASEYGQYLLNIKVK